MLKDNDSRLRYAPSPTTVSFTGNIGPEDYTELSPKFYADVRGKVDASNALPYLSGTRPIVVRAYKDVVLASAFFKPGILCGVSEKGLKRVRREERVSVVETPTH